MVKHRKHNTKAKQGLTCGGLNEFGFTALSNVLIRCFGKLGLSDSAFRLVTCILTHARDDNDQPFPSIELLMEYTTWSRAKTFRVLKELRDRELVEVLSGSNGRANRYDFTPLWEACWEYAPKEKASSRKKSPQAGQGLKDETVQGLKDETVEGLTDETLRTTITRTTTPPYGRGRADARAPSPSGGSISPEPEIEGQGEEEAEHLSSSRGTSISGPEGERPRAATGETEESESTPEKQGKKANSNDVRDWFEEAAAKHMPQLPSLPSWSVKDRMNAKRLLEEYGPETTRMAVAFFWQHWEGYRASSRGRLNGVPTPGLLYGMRDQVITDMQLGHVPGGRTSGARGERLDERSRRLSRDEYDPSRDATADAYAWC